MKQVLVIGATGLVGMNLVKQLSMREIATTAVIHRKEPLEKWDNIMYCREDLANVQACEKLISGHDTVFICASQKFSAGLANIKPAERVFETLNMTMNILQSCLRHQVKSVVLLSSASVYTELNKIMSEEDNIFTAPVPDNRFYYVWLKRMIENCAEMVYRDPANKNMGITILRPTNIYGPYDDFNLDTSYVMPALIRKVADGLLPLTLWGDGEAYRNFVFVEDLVRAMILASQRPDGYQIYNIGAERPISLKELALKILKLSGEASTKLKLDLTKPSSNVAVEISFDKIRKDLNYIPEVSIEQGILATREWYLTNKDLYKNKE